MMAALDHRGPDDRGLYQDAQVSLGMTRLAIIDPSANGHQPMANPNQTIWIVCNGEIYNYQSERRLLEARGYNFSSSSDTEVALRMYEHYGDEFLLRLRGMFALAIYDKRQGPGRERLLLARDCFGIKPLLYTRVGKRFIFASELKALLASGFVPREIDPIALRLLLTYGHVSQPRTILRGVSMLPPSHYLVIEAGRERIQRYWSLQLNRRPSLRSKPYEELISELAGTLEESVKLHLLSDVPVGAFLSGGIDSSLLTALMMQLVSRPVKTFSVGFGAEGTELDESGDARRVAEYLGTEHTTVMVDGAEVRDRIRHFAFSLDQPSIDGINTYFVSLAASKSVKVAISGVGSDELFAGYSWFMQMVVNRGRERSQPWKTLARSLLVGIVNQPAFDSLMLAPGGRFLGSARNNAGFFNNYDRFMNSSFGSLGAARLLRPEIRREAQAGRSPEIDQKVFDELPTGSIIERVTGLCLRGYMTNQLLRDIDAVSMAHSLEVRVPFLDREVAETALSLPDHTKLNDPSGLNASTPYSYRQSGVKRILMDIGRPLLPNNFDLTPKRGFLLPFEAWMKASLLDVLHDTLSEKQLLSRGLLDTQQVLVLKQHFLTNPLHNPMAWVKPWLLIMLELWCREILDRPTDCLASF